MTTKKILCPVDFSETSDHAVTSAVEVAKALGCEVELLHVYQLPMLALPDGVITATPTFVTDLTNRAQRALDVLRKRLQDQGVTTTTRLVEGQPAQTIVQLAAATPAVAIIMGTHGRSGVQRFLLGSVAERVTRMATVPVLTIPMPKQPQARAAEA